MTNPVGEAIRAAACLLVENWKPHTVVGRLVHWYLRTYICGDVAAKE